MGISIKGRNATIAWFKYISWTKGISPNEFNKCYAKDIRDIMSIHEAIGQKELREAQIKKMMNKVTTKW